MIRQTYINSYETIEESLKINSKLVKIWQLNYGGNSYDYCLFNGYPYIKIS